MGDRQESKDVGGDPPATYPQPRPRGYQHGRAYPFTNLHIEAHIAGPYLWCRLIAGHVPPPFDQMTVGIDGLEPKVS